MLQKDQRSLFVSVLVVDNLVFVCWDPQRRSLVWYDEAGFVFRPRKEVIVVAELPARDVEDVSGAVGCGDQEAIVFPEDFAIGPGALPDEHEARIGHHSNPLHFLDFL